MPRFNDLNDGPYERDMLAPELQGIPAEDWERLEQEEDEDILAWFREPMEKRLDLYRTAMIPLKDIDALTDKEFADYLFRAEWKTRDFLKSNQELFWFRTPACKGFMTNRNPRLFAVEVWDAGTVMCQEIFISAPDRQKRLETVHMLLAGLRYACERCPDADEVYNLASNACRRHPLFKDASGHAVKIPLDRLRGDW